MKRTIFSWNVNGLRAVIRKDVFVPFIKKYQPDVLCLQETKAEQKQVTLDLPDYVEYWNSAEKKGYSGTAIFTKEKPLSVIHDLLPEVKKQKKILDEQGRDAESEGRVLTVEFPEYYVVTVYTPNAKDDLSRVDFRKNVWDVLFLEHCKALEKKKHIVFCGDLNVAHKEIDLARPKANKGKKGFTDEERQGFDNFIDAGFIDTFRHIHGDKKEAYSWWSYWAKSRERNIGWRIDYVLTSKKLQSNITDANIHTDVMGSDHCPVSVTLT